MKSISINSLAIDINRLINVEKKQLSLREDKWPNVAFSVTLNAHSRDNRKKSGGDWNCDEAKPSPRKNCERLQREMSRYSGATQRVCLCECVVKLGLVSAEIESKYRHFCLQVYRLYLWVCTASVRTSVSNKAAQWQRFTTWAKPEYSLLDCNNVKPGFNGEPKGGGWRVGGAGLPVSSAIITHTHTCTSLHKHTWCVFPTGCTKCCKYCILMLGDKHYIERKYLL